MATKKVSDLDALTSPAVGDLLLVTDISEAIDADKTKKITISNLGKGFDVLQNLKIVGFPVVYDNGASGTSKTIDWATNGNKQKLQITGNACDLSYTDPTYACTLTLWLYGDGTLRTNVDADHDADCEWIDGGEPNAYGSTDDEVIGVLKYEFDPDNTPKYIVAGVSVGA